MNLIEPEGTPFAYIDLPESWDSEQLCRELLDEYKVLLMPAEVFGSNHAIRISFGRPEALLKEGLDRIGKLLSSYSK